MKTVVVPAGAVERTVQAALAGRLPTYAETTTASATLCWTAQPVDGEGALPGATMTWQGHGGAGRPTGALVDRVLEHADVAVATKLPELIDLPVGSALVGALADVDVADAGDAELVDVAARWQEVISWATAMQSRAAGEIARRRGWTEEHTTAAAEVSARLRVPQGDANKLMARGSGLAEHPQVMDALHRGRIDTAKADILLRSGNPLTTEERDQAITLYLPQAPDRTRRWLRDKMNQYATRLHGSTELAKQAMTRRAVYLDPADNSMAWISANLPATDATAVWDAVEQAAHTLRRTPGNTRTLTQARADAFVAIATGRVIVPPSPECAPEDATNQAPNGGDSTPDHDAGTIVSALPRTTMPATGCTCGGCLCGGTGVRVVTVEPQVRVTMPATMLLGLDDTPGHLDGYGPIPAQTAARIATDATWQRLLTDPATGILTDYSTTAYQPGKVLRQAVTARDQTCCFPQCDRPARWADLDHIQPFDHELDPTAQPPDAPGQTRATNLQPLCRAHHLAKTHHGWDVTRDPDTGVTTWTAPTGHIRTRPPTRTGPTTEPATGTHPRTGHISNDVTSLADDIRHRLGHHPTVGKAANPAPSQTRRIRQSRPTNDLFPSEPPF